MLPVFGVVAVDVAAIEYRLAALGHAHIHGFELQFPDAGGFGLLELQLAGLVLVDGISVGAVGDSRDGDWVGEIVAHGDTDQRCERTYNDGGDG